LLKSPWGYLRQEKKNPSTPCRSGREESTGEITDGGKKRRKGTLVGGVARPKNAKRKARKVGQPKKGIKCTKKKGGTRLKPVWERGEEGGAERLQGV